MNAGSAQSAGAAQASRAGLTVFCLTLSGILSHNPMPQVRLFRRTLAVVAVAALAVGARAQPAGALDALFGDGGRVTLDVGRTRSNRATAIAVQPDGKILVAGDAADTGAGSPGALAVTRYTADGSLDVSFGTGGHAVVGIGVAARTSAVAVQADGGIVVAGSLSRPGTGPDFAVARFTPAGTPDPSFGGTGLVVTSFLADFGDDAARALAIQPDGRIVAAGYASLPGLPGQNGARAFGVARYLPNGALDASFDGDGRALVRSQAGSPEGDRAAAVVVLPGGRIVLAGSARDVNGLGGAFAVARLTAAGALDPTFGQGGFLTEPATQSGWAAIAVGSDGRLVLSGTTCTASCFSSTTVFAARAVVLEPSGATRSVLSVAVPGATQVHTTAVVARPDGGAVVSGYATVGGRTRVVQAAFLASGQPDTAFGAAGIGTAAFGPATDDYAYALARLPDGRLVSVGTTLTPGSGASRYALVRHTAAGMLDASFGTGGLVATDGVAPGFDQGHAVAVQPDGRIVVAGASGYGPEARLLLARFEPGGAPDATFGTGGVAAAIPGAVARAVVVQPDGRVVVAGAFLIQDAGRSVFGVARYGADGTPDATFGSGGIVTVGSVGSEARGVAVLPDGDLLAVGAVAGAFTVVRLSPAGVVRAATAIAFSNSGTPLNQGGATSVAVQPDGRVVVAGVATNTSLLMTTYSVVARLTASGDLDPTFGSGGRAYSLSGRSSSSFSVDAVALQPDGRVVIGGRTSTSPFLARFTVDGQTDASFGTAGSAVLGIPLDRVAAVAVDATGRIAVTGRPAGLTADLVVGRYTAAGLPDTAFGGTGSVQVDITGGYDGASALALDGSGGIVAVGYGGRATSTDLALVRLLADDRGTPTDADADQAGLALVAFPNPATARLSVRYTLPEAGRVRLVLVDVLGREVAVVADGAQPPGPAAASLDASRLPAGLYVLRLTAGTAAAALRVTVAR